MASIIRRFIFALISAALLCTAGSTAVGLPASRIGRLPRPAGQSRDYGPLGNLLKWLVDGADEKNMDPVSETFQASKIHQVAGDRRAPDYGLLGNIVVGMIQRWFGDSSSPARSTSTDKRSIVSEPLKAPSAEINTPNQSDDRKPNKTLQNVRELVKLLSSNFLKDRTFERAAEELRDEAWRLDDLPGSGGFLSLAEQERLLGRAAPCALCLP